MDFESIIQHLGISKYTEKFRECYQQLPEETNFCDLEEIAKYSEEYEILGKYTDLVMKAAEEVRKDEALFLYGKIWQQYRKVSTNQEFRDVLLPEFDGSVGRDMYGVLIMFMLMPESVRFYKEHGFTHEQIKAAYTTIPGCLGIVERNSGIPRSNQLYFSWSMLYIYGEIFSYKGFNYNFRKFYENVVILKNKQTNQCVSMMINGTFHKSGLVLGSAGAEDPEGSFAADFHEDDNAFYGHLAINCKVSAERAVCSKTEWECILQPGDEVLGAHIPRNTDLTPEAVLCSFRGSLAFGKELFPERAPKGLVCSTWLLSEDLYEMLPADSKILGFSDLFLRIPIKSSGLELKEFVFPGHEGPLETLPETTSLQRKIKARMLSGGHVLAAAGVFVDL